MVRKLMTTALVLLLGLSAAGCGAGNAGTAAYRWDDRGNEALEYQNQAGDSSRNGNYYAGSDGRVDGVYDGNNHNKGENALERAGEDIMNAGEDLADGAKNAAENIGTTAKNALDDVTGNNTNNHTNNHKNNNTSRSADVNTSTNTRNKMN